MILQVGNVTTRLVSGTDEERRWLSEYLTFDDSRARFIKGLRGDGRIRLFNSFSSAFPSGFLKTVVEAAAVEGFDAEVLDPRQPPCAPDPTADLAWLRDYQLAAVDACVERAHGIVRAPTGSGKCLGKGTPVMLATGDTVPVEQVCEGDLLMGPDSKPREVLSTTSGEDYLYMISPTKGTPWVCNAAHVLTLVETVSGNVVDVPLRDYLSSNHTFKHTHKQFHVAVDFPNSAPLPVDPYFLGVWFGDGRKDLSQSICISKPDEEIRELCADTAIAYGLTLQVDVYPGKCPSYRLSGTKGPNGNKLLTLLRHVVGPGVQIPLMYLTASRGDRAAFLAGMLDTDGYMHRGGYDIVQKREDYADALVFLARSLGLQATKKAKEVPAYGRFWRVSISGDCSWLPLRIPRKKAPPRQQKKNVTRTGFVVEPIGKGAYYGFTLDGDGRFLLGDFTVTHNTEILAALTRALPCRWLMLVHRTTLVHQAAERVALRTGERVGIVAEGRWEGFDDDTRIVCASYQTLYARRHTLEAQDLLKKAEGICPDECHTIPSHTAYSTVMAAPNAYYRIGLSATPLARGDKRSVLAVAALGPIIYQIKPDVLIEAGVLAKPHIRMVPIRQESERPTWQGVYGELVVRSRQRNAAVVAAVKSAEKPCLVFVRELSHGRVLEQALGKAGLRTAFVSGQHSTAWRRSHAKRLEQGHFDALICSVVFQEGVDLPELRSVVIACGGASVIAALQRIGRGMRVAAGKDSFEVHDFLDEGQRWMERHARARRRAYSSEGFAVIEGDAAIGAVV